MGAIRLHNHRPARIREGATPTIGLLLLKLTMLKIGNTKSSRPTEPCQRASILAVTANMPEKPSLPHESLLRRRLWTLYQNLQHPQFA